MALIRVLVSVALFAIALIVILDNLGVNVTALVAGLGIGGIAIGLAAQGIFSDLFAALAIMFDRPFRRGDTIRYGTTTGTVERIGLKTTRHALGHRRAGDHGQHQIARAGDSQPRRGQGAPRHAALRPDLPDPARAIARALPDIARPGASARSRAAAWSAASRPASAPARSTPSWSTTTARIDPDKLAAHKSAIIIALDRAPSPSKASPSLTRPRRPSPPPPTARWSCRGRRPRRQDLGLP